MTEHTVLPKKPPTATLVFILSSAFLFAMGIGLLGPVLPYLVGRYVPDPAALAATVSWLSVSYAFCAFFAAPLLGALSDRYGRKPVMLISLLGSAIGYFIFGWAGTLTLMFVGRIIDGITAGNFSANFGMLADSTEPEERGKYFGQIGAAIGGGFILGPALGGLVSQISLEAPVFVAAGLCLLNLLWGVLFVPETLNPEHPNPRATRHPPHSPFAALERAVCVALRHDANPFWSAAENHAQLGFGAA
jgi:MFS transporter, DHA1 family, tetracycline resistance protein